MKHRTLLAVSVGLLAVSLILYLEVQLVSKGPLGTDPFLYCFSKSPDYWTYGGTVAPNSCTFFNYDQALEVTGFAGFFTFLTWNYLNCTGRGRFRQAIGRTILTYGVIVGSVVFITNYVLWKLPGYAWVKNPLGLPWWSEQVTYQTCFIKQADFSSAHPNCVFLNYGNVFEICILFAIVGYILMTLPLQND